MVKFQNCKEFETWKNQSKSCIYYYYYYYYY